MYLLFFVSASRDCTDTWRAVGALRRKDASECEYGRLVVVAHVRQMSLNTMLLHNEDSTLLRADAVWKFGNLIGETCPSR